MQTMYDRASARLLDITRTISADQFENRTPCTKYNVRGLLNHLFFVSQLMLDAAEGKDVDMTSTPPDYVGQQAEWHRRFEDKITEVAETFSRPEVQKGDDLLGVPRQMAVYMPLFDLVIHAWDLARATEQSCTPDQETVEALREFAEGMIPQGRKMGAFAEEFPVGEKDSDFAKLLGLTGRDPSWTGIRS